MRTEEIALSRIAENENNPRTISEEKFRKLVKSVLVFPRMLALRPIVVDETMTVLGGNMRLKTLRHILEMNTDAVRGVIAENEKLTELEAANLGSYWDSWRKKPTAIIVKADDLTEAQKREFIIKDNVGFGDWDTDMLANQWDVDALKDWGIEDWQLGMGADADADGELDEDTERKEREGTVEKCFLIPPFSVLDTRRGNWQNRRNYWLMQGIKSELGRGSNITFSKGCQPPAIYGIRNKLRKKTGVDPSWDAIEKYCKDNNIKFQKSTSVFDPVLCECAYRWFMPDGGKYILDPFCGGSVRGIVASKCGYEYFGRDLRPEQIAANEANCDEVLSAEDIRPEYSCGDSLEIGQAYKNRKADLLFSCPPYADLEIYSDDARDISNMRYPEFLEVYRKIIHEACQCLHDNRFVVWVVSEVRGKDGEYYGLIPDTISAFSEAGCHYYNEFVLINQVSSAAIRIGRSFNATRKTVRVHQNVLVFFKGDMNKIKGLYPELDLSYLQEQMEDNEMVE